MNIGACFDSSSIHSGQHRFNNIELTLHDKWLDEDYNIFRGEGFSIFRESCWLEKTFVKKDINWDWLDRLAKLSNGQIQLAISHYNYPTTDIFSFCSKLANRYKGQFHSYIPFVESGVYCHMLTEYLLPHYNSWWAAWEHVSDMQATMVNAIKTVDPECRIALSEPFNSFASYEIQARPFNTLLGRYDEEAQRYRCYTSILGHESFLDIIGLNILHYDEKVPVHNIILEAQKLFPNKEIAITETTNMWHQHIPSWEWMKYVCSEAQIAEEMGVNINTVMYCPSIQMYSHDRRELIGGYLYDINRKRA